MIELTVTMRFDDELQSAIDAYHAYKLHTKVVAFELLPSMDGKHFLRLRTTDWDATTKQVE